MNSKKFKILLVILVIVIFISLNKFARTSIENTFYIITSPISKIFWQSGRTLSETLAAFFEVRNLKIQNQLLLSQNFKLIREINQLKRQEEENEVLRKVLNLELNKKFEFLLAKAIAEDIDQDFILISQGEDTGVKKNMVVITEEGILVGKVKEVFPNFSKVKLITAKDSVFDVLVNEGLGLAKGQGNLGLSLQLVPKENQIGRGDIVQTTSFGGTFPEGLLVGKVRNIQRADVEPYARGEISPFFTQTQLKFLLVIKNFLPIE